MNIFYTYFILHECLLQRHKQEVISVTTETGFGDANMRSRTGKLSSVSLWPGYPHPHNHTSPSSPVTQIPLIVYSHFIILCLVFWCPCYTSPFYWFASALVVISISPWFLLTCGTFYLLVSAHCLTCACICLLHL